MTLMNKEEKRKYIFAQLNSLPNAFQYVEVTGYIKSLEEENKELHNKIDEISDFIKENKIKRYRVIESEDYDEEIVLDEDDITCLERIINDEYDYENR